MFVTPIVPLMTDENGNRFYMKREDLLPYSFGGNKARIGMAYLRDLKAGGYDRLIAYGNARSNLCRVLCNLCAGEGIPVTLISPADDDGERLDTFNSTMCGFFGAEIVPCTKTNVAETVDAVMASSLAAGEKPYYIYGNRLGQGREEIPAGAYYDVYAEILSQEKELGVTFDVIALAAGTGMTLGGLAAGRAESAEKRKLLGLSIARDSVNAAAHTLRYANACLESRGSNLRVTSGDLTIRDEWRECYGVYSEAVRQEIRDMLRLYGIPLDGTYTGKAWHALREAAGELHGQSILFIHTGGSPLFFDAVAGGILSGEA